MQIIGGAARSLSATFREGTPHIPCSKIVGMRNVLVRHYFGIDREAVWAVVIKDLPELRRAVEAILPDPDSGGTEVR